MKRLKYTWDDDYYLLHLQLTSSNADGASAVLTREFSTPNREAELEWLVVQPGTCSHRIMVCRTHPMERNFTVEYPPATTLEIFQLEDRAFYPTRVHRAE